MPPTLDLSKTKAHGAMCLSPRPNVRRAPSYPHEKPPNSATASGFSFGGLMPETPLTPSLPALIHRHGKIEPSPHTQKYLRLVMWIAGVATLLYFVSTQLRLEHSVPSVGWSTSDGHSFEMVGDDELPDFPTPLLVEDKRGRAKWTVSIPVDAEFPLQQHEYYDICAQANEVAHQAEDLHSHHHKLHAAHYGYYHVDSNFMDVREAVEYKLLPGPAATKGGSLWNYLRDKNSMVGERPSSLVESEVCETTMTFVMESSNAGLGHTLMMLWTAYGLAQEEGRAFFIDDTRWAYGDYTKYFRAPPMPSCRPPPRYEMLPCPHHARHLVVSAATAKWTFGGQFNEFFEDGHKMEVFRQKKIFDFAHAGYTALFLLASEDEQYVQNRIGSLRNKTMDDRGEHGMLIGAHVRHGDRHPLEFEYADAYIPLDRFANTAQKLVREALGESADDNTLAQMKNLLVLASDDPDVYESDEFAAAVRAQDYIRLASQKTLMNSAGAKPTNSAKAMRRFVEETVGWEGGFFAPMFWSLGASGKTAADVTVVQMKTQPTQEALRLRELIGRAYLMDMMMLGRAADRVVCTVSSMSCRLLAVMMGWDLAIEQGYWVNVDGDFPWRGVDW